MSAIEPSGSVAKNWNCKKDVVNRAICSYNAHRHRKLLGAGAGVYGNRRVITPTVSSLQAILPFLPLYGKVWCRAFISLIFCRSDECNFKRRKTGCLGWWIVGIIQKTILLMWRRTVVLV